MTEGDLMLVMINDAPTAEDLANVLEGLNPSTARVINLATFEPSLHSSGETLVRRSPTS